MIKKCLKWCLFNNLNPADYHPAKIRKTNKNFERKLVSKVIKFPVKIRDIHKIDEKNVSASVFWLLE